jgi:cation diffusion facilitator CzcD-associated flavoprotein CzcO/acetyl esterase/lipase
MSAPHYRVAIVGTGFAGLGAAVRLLQEGVESLVVFERAESVGGVWRDNTYPGAACDVRSHLYAFSFVPNPDWSRRYSPQPEIRAYLERVAERFGVLPHVRFGHDVTEAAWDDGAARWTIETNGGTHTADVLVAAPGALAEPRYPEIPGLGDFAGAVMHTARWDDGVAIDGARVAIVGTGASAIQVIPAIQSRVEELIVYQRTPAWVIPRRDAPFAEGTRRRFRERPGVHGLLRRALFGYHEVNGLPFRHPRLAEQVERVMRWRLRQQVRDPELRRVLTPDYRLGCKRILLSDDYYPALTQPNVTVVDGALRHVLPHATVGADGVERPTDVVVLATGFHVSDLPFAGLVAGRDGRRLAEVWGPSPTAHLGTTVHGFPNFFLLQGPNTGLGHSSVVLMAEAQVEHVVHALEAMDARALAAVEPKAEAQAAWVAEVDRRAEDTVWTSGGCASWYLDETGRNAALWPGSVPAFRRRVEPFDPDEYRLRPRWTLSGDGQAGDPPTLSVPRTEPTAEDRALGLAARAAARLPEAAQVALAGRPPPEVDGQRLDPAVHLALALHPRPNTVPLVRHDPGAARAGYRRDVLALTGTPTRVGAVRDLTVDGGAGLLDARLYTPAHTDGPPPLVVYLHGGGFVEGDLDTHDEVCRLLCRQAGHAVLSVAYRLAPEHPFPAAFDDAVAVFRWAQREAARLGADPDRVAVGGDSAGGNLAAGVAQATRDDAPPAAQLLLYPATDHPGTYASRRLFDGYLLPDPLREAFFDVYTQGAVPADDPRVSPIYGRLDGLAPAFVLTAGFDVLRDEGEAYARVLEAAGTPTALYRQASLPHGFLHLAPISRGAERATVAAFRRWRRFVAGQAVAVPA